MLFHVFNMRHTNTEVVMNNYQYYKLVHEKLKEWKIHNNINERCVVHHRDDTEETCKYNNEHYYRWGCDEDGSFEYGKYVVFMTRREHIKHHHTGAKRSEEICRHISESRKGQYTDKQREAFESLHARQTGINNPMYGRRHTEESRRKMSEHSKGQISAFKGKHHSEQVKSILSDAQRAYQEKMHKLFDTYKALNGNLKYRAFCKAIKSGEISLDAFNNN